MVDIGLFDLREFLKGVFSFETEDRTNLEQTKESSREVTQNESKGRTIHPKTHLHLYYNTDNPYGLSEWG